MKYEVTAGKDRHIFSGSSMAEPPAHNWRDVGSNPTRRTKGIFMKIGAKRFKALLMSSVSDAAISRSSVTEEVLEKSRQAVLELQVSLNLQTQVHRNKAEHVQFP